MVHRDRAAGFLAVVGICVCSGCLPVDLFTPFDNDGDGWLSDQDCDDGDAAVHPGANDPGGDGVDQDCDGFDGDSAADSDGDGIIDEADCDPHDPETYPGAPDPYGDGIDQDCDECGEGGGDGIDRDCDGYPANSTVADEARDCDDEDAAVHPDAEELCDGVDNDCSDVADDPWGAATDACGEGTWGELPVDSSTVFVDFTASPGGDGSEGAPLDTIQDGLDLAASSGATLVAVAAGAYVENLVVDDEHAGVHLAGRCAQMVFLDAGGGEDSDYGVQIDTVEGSFQLSGLTVLGADRMGIWISSGEIELSDLAVDGAEYGVCVSDRWVLESTVSIERSRIHGSSRGGLFVTGGGSSVVAEALGISGVGEETESGFGVLTSVGAFSGDNLCVRDIYGSGVSTYSEGAQASLTSSFIADTRAADTDGYGLLVRDGAALEGTDLQISGAEGNGVLCEGSGSTADLDSVEITDTIGVAMTIADGSVLQCSRCDLQGSSYAGLALDGAEVTFQAGSILDVGADDALGGGFGVLASSQTSASTLSLRSSSIEGTELSAVHVLGGGSFELERNELTGGTGLEADGSCAFGVYATGTTAEDLRLSLNIIRDAAAVGMLLDGASASLVGNTWVDNAVDLVVQGDDCDVLPEGYEEAGSYESCPEPEYPVCGP